MNVEAKERLKKYYRNKRDWNFEQPEDHKLIPLTQGKFAKVDNEDFERVKDINWGYTHGYARNKELGYMHRVILKSKHGEYVDHENKDTLDNRKCNIRICSNAENIRSSKLKINNTSGLKGVYFRADRSTWRAEIKCNYKKTVIGTFKDKEEAGMAYDRKALELFGDFAYLNFPELKDEYLKELGI